MFKVMVVRWALAGNTVLCARIWQQKDQCIAQENVSLEIQGGTVHRCAALAFLGKNTSNFKTFMV